jgi:hypothetical protein
MCRGVKGGFNCYYYTGKEGLPFGADGHVTFFKVNDYGSSEFRRLAVLYDRNKPYFCIKDKSDRIKCSRLKVTNGKGSFDHTFILAYGAGYNNIKQIVDVDGDGQHEYCREVGDRNSNRNKNRIECVRGKKIFLSVQRESLGYGYFRQFADFNGDKQIDYIRAEGDEPNTFVTISEYKKVKGKLVVRKTVNHRPGID